MTFKAKIRFSPITWLTAKAITFILVLCILPALALAQTITFSSNNPAVPAANLLVPSTKQPIYRAVVVFSVGNGNNLTNVTFTPNGTFTVNDIITYEVWYNTTDNLATASKSQNANATTFGGSGDLVSIDLNNPSFNTGATYYFWITTDISSSANTDDSHAIIVNALTPSNFVFTKTATKSGTMYNGGTQTLISANPNIIVSPKSLSAFSYIVGNGPSAAQTYTVRGTGLTNNVTLTAPSHFEISMSSGSGYTNSFTLNQSGGVLASTTIYVRIKAGYAIETYNAENITHVSTGASTKNVSCNGQVTCNLSPPTVISPINYCQNATASQLTANGQNLSWVTSGNSNVGGTTDPTASTHSAYNNSYTYTYFTVTSNVAFVNIYSIDWGIPANQSVTGVQIAIQNSNGTAVANGTQSNAPVSLSGVGYFRKQTSSFSNLVLTPGDYRITLVAGSGNFGSFNNPGYPQTEAFGSINITGNGSTDQLYYNLQFAFTKQSSIAPTPITSVIGTTYYYVTQTVSGCTSGPATIEVTVSTTCNTITTGTVSGSPFCAGDAVSIPFSITGTFTSGNVFTAQLSDATGSFTTPVTLGSLTQTTAGTISGTIPTNMSGGTAYRIQVVSSNPNVTGSSNPSNFTINATPTATAGGPDNACQSASPSAITLSGSSVGGSATTGAWSITSGGGSLSSTAQLASPATVTYTTAANFSGTVTLLLTSNAGTGCTAATSSRIINVNALSVAPTSISGTTTVCNGSTTTLTAVSGTLGTGANYQWGTGSVVGTNPISGATSISYLTPALSSSTTYWVYITNTTAPCTTSTGGVTQLATVNPNLPVSVSIAAAPSGAICAGTSVTFTATATNGGTPTYQWYNGAATVGTNSDNFTSATLANSDAITVKMTSSLICTTGNPATSNSITMPVDELPTAATITISPLNYCGTLASGSLGGNTPGVGTGEWSITSGGTGTFSAPGNGNSTFTADAYGTYVLTWTISNGTCTASTADVTVNYYGDLTAGISGGSSPICYNTAPGTFTATSGGGTSSYSYLWYKDSATTGITTQTYAPGNLTATSDFYCAITSGACGTVNTSTTTITVFALVQTNVIQMSIP